MKSYDTDDFLEDIRNMTGHLEEAGLERAIVVDLTREEIGVPVVRVIVPGLEISAVDSERVGGRVKNAKMPNVVVFLGPSLPEAEAREILDADYRPPAKRGDLFKAAKDGAEVICLIDGVFFQECSVAHKEVLYALDNGVKVIGASSMGALRASELDVYGMEGVGEIYEAYRRKELVSDDEVALMFDPYTFEPLSEPLINIRHNLKIAVKEGVLDEECSLALLQEAMSLYFPDRTYDRIINACKGRVAEELLERFKSFIDTERSDLKKEDAIRAIRRAGELADEA